MTQKAAKGALGTDFLCAIAAVCAAAGLGCSGSSFTAVGTGPEDASGLPEASVDASAGHDSAPAEDATNDARIDSSVELDAPVWDSSTEASQADVSIEDSASDVALEDAVQEDAFDAAPSVCEPGESPGDGVFVSAASGDDRAGDGTSSYPVKTLAKAVTLGVQLRKQVIYLDQGIYPEWLSLISYPIRLEVLGGWKRTGVAWSRDCSNDARSRTLIQSSNSLGLYINQLPQPVALRHLTVQSKAQGIAGESCFGISVVNTPQLTLEDVDVLAGIGGDGQSTDVSTPGQRANCGTGIGQDCWDGLSGFDGRDGAASTSWGSFTANGFFPGDGIAGTAGGAGHNGSVGTAGQSGTCSAIAGCVLGPGICQIATCTNAGVLGTISGGHGTCGCGGEGGSAGGAGHGGGASVGLLLAGAQTSVTVLHSRVVAQAGGDGSAGGLGTEGVVGTQGAPGMGVMCYGPCTLEVGDTRCACTQPQATQLSGGLGGGQGGRGGRGGNGTGGAGGPSIAIVQLGGAQARSFFSQLVFGDAGHGADAPDGIAVESYSGP